MKVSFVKEDNGTIGAPSASGTGVGLSTFNGVMTITVGTSDVTVTFADQA